VSAPGAVESQQSPPDTVKVQREQSPSSRSLPPTEPRYLYENPTFMLAFTGSMVVVWLASGRQPLLAAAALLSGSCSLVAYSRRRARVITAKRENPPTARECASSTPSPSAKQVSQRARVSEQVLLPGLTSVPVFRIVAGTRCLEKLLWR